MILYSCMFYLHCLLTLQDSWYNTPVFCQILKSSPKSREISTQHAQKKSPNATKCSQFCYKQWNLAALVNKVFRTYDDRTDHSVGVKLRNKILILADPLILHWNSACKFRLKNNKQSCRCREWLRRIYDCYLKQSDQIIVFFQIENFNNKNFPVSRNIFTIMMVNIQTESHIFISN